MHSFARISALALGIAGVLAAGHAGASGFQLKENSSKAEGRAMAGSASAFGDASAVTNNPALMSTFETTTFQSDVSVIDLSFDFTGGGNAAAGSPLQRPLTGGDGGNAGGMTPVPAFSIVVPLSGQFDYVTLGAMVSAPFGLKTEYDRDWVGRYHAVKSDVKVIDLTLAASIALSDRFSVGLGAVIESADVTLSNAVDFGSSICRINVALCVTPNPVTAPFGPEKNDGFAEIKGDDVSLGWIFGANWRPTDSLSIGYMHRSEVDHDLEGSGDFTVPGNVSSLLGVAAPGQFVDTSVKAALTLPSVDTLSVTWMVNDRLSLMAEASKTDWHSFQEIRIQFDSAQADSAEQYGWKDSYMYSIGGEYKLSDAFTLRAGIARDETPVEAATRTPRLPDNDRDWYTVGATWSATPHWDLTASYIRLEISDDPTVDLVSSSGSRLTGTFEGGANIYAVSAQYKF